ncbi:MAG: hypothetical protein K2X77_34085 [Candidatus Obscuribacterales bacterium]|jgi:hypothetical protein|nr:hypothetical protein [Candidatus Obscuribacterales bacterium]
MASHFPLKNICRATEIGTRATTLRDRCARMKDENPAIRVSKAERAVEHAIMHIMRAYDGMMMSDNDRDFYLGLADIDLDRAEELLNTAS